MVGPEGNGTCRLPELAELLGTLRFRRPLRSIGAACFHHGKTPVFPTPFPGFASFYKPILKTAIRQKANADFWWAQKESNLRPQLKRLLLYR